METTIQDLSEVIKNTYENKHSEINSLVSLLGIEPAKLSEKKKISADTELILNSLSILDKRLSQIEVISLPTKVANQKPLSVPENLGDPLLQSDLENLKVGDSIFHVRHGQGTISQIQKTTSQYIYAIKFDNNVMRRFILNSSSIAYFRKLK